MRPRAVFGLVIVMLIGWDLAKGPVRLWCNKISADDNRLFALVGETGKLAMG